MTCLFTVDSFPDYHCSMNKIGDIDPILCFHPDNETDRYDNKVNHSGEDMDKHLFEFIRQDCIMDDAFSTSSTSSPEMSSETCYKNFSLSWYQTQESSPPPTPFMYDLDSMDIKPRSMPSMMSDCSNEVEEGSGSELSTVNSFMEMCKQDTFDVHYFPELPIMSPLKAESLVTSLSTPSPTPSNTPEASLVYPFCNMSPTDMIENRPSLGLDRESLMNDSTTLHLPFQFGNPIKHLSTLKPKTARRMKVKPEKIKRPPNAFILYRQFMHRELFQTLNISNNAFSTLVGDLWKN